MAAPGIEIYGNNAATTLAAGINSSATSLTVLGGTGNPFPSPAAGQFFRFTLNDALTGLVFEIIYAQGRSGDTFTSLLRGQEGTTAVAWLAADKLFEGVTAGAMANLTQAQQVQQNYFNYAVDSGSANAYAIALPISMATPVPGALIYWLAANVNTGASTITVNGSGAYPLLGGARSALQGGEVGRFCVMTYDAALSSYVLLDSSGGNPQVPTATKSGHALSLGTAQAAFAALNGNTAQQFAASQLTTPVLTSGASALYITTSSTVSFTNLAESTFIPVSGGKGTVSTSSNQFVTGAQLQNVYKVGEVKMYHGSVASIASVWGPGWQLADGTNGTANLKDRFIIGAGNLYAVNAVGGAATIALTTTQLPVHNHVINIGDPGHAHGVYDPTHAHSVADPGHAHSVADPGHSHVSPWGESTSAYAPPWGVYGSNNLIGSSGHDFDNSWGYTSPSGTGIGIYASGTGIGIYGAYTGIGIYASGTGIYANSNNAGAGAAFSILPPYYALCFIEYTGIGA